MFRRTELVALDFCSVRISSLSLSRLQKGGKFIFAVDNGQPLRRCDWSVNLGSGPLDRPRQRPLFFSLDDVVFAVLGLAGG